MNWSPAFSRASRSLFVFSLSSQRLIAAVVQTLVKSKAHDRLDEEIREKNWC